MQREKKLEALMSLGLTYLQAKAYLALAQFGRAEARTIAKASGVARQDIYRIMPTLEKLGLAEKEVASPALYKATPLKEGLTMLLHAKAAEEMLLRKKVKSLLNDDNDGNYAIVHDETTQFIITSEKNLFVKRFQTSFSEAVTCDFIFRPFALNFVMFNYFESIRIATARGARIRILTQNRNISPLINRKLEILKKSSFFQIRLTCSLIDLGIAIFNNKEVNVCISGNSSSVPSIWTNNPQFVKMAQITFESEWSKAQNYIQLNVLNTLTR